MISRIKAVLFSLFLLFMCFIALALPTRAGKVLDDILNNMRLGEPAMLRDEANTLDITTQSPVGQTFVTGEKVTKICRIAVAVKMGVPGWDPGENLILTLYDGPEKKNKLADFTMESTMGFWEDGINAFPLWVNAKPYTTYYFELTVSGGDGKIPMLRKPVGDYPDGCAFIAGKPQQFDIWFETHVKGDLDRDAVYSRAFADVNLDYPGLERVKLAVQIKDWDVAVKELVKEFESNPNRINSEKRKNPKLDPKFDTSFAELISNQKYLDADGKEIDLRPDWNHLHWWPTRGGIGLTRTGLRGPLAHAYYATRNEKYAKAWNDMLVAYFTCLPSPLLAGVIKADDSDIDPAPHGGLAGGSMWAGLSIAARMGHGFAYYESFVDSPSFETDTRAAFIFDLVNMAKVLAVQKGGGNWATQMTSSLFEFGDNYPEFAQSRDWFNLGYKGIMDNLYLTLSPDGPIGESTAYQTMCAGGFLETLVKAKKLDLLVPEDAWKKVEKAYEFELLTMFPDTRIPAWGDGNTFDISKMMMGGYEAFKRKDMLWVATDSKEGISPSVTSVAFPHTGYFVTRSDWDPDARFMCLHNAGYTSHGHADSLSFVLSAYGSELITDPGVYIYGTPDAIRQSSTRSHSTIQVDGRDLARQCGDTLWFSGNCVDFLDATGANYGDDLDAVPVRRMVFVKPDYWVISDVVKGSGKHKIESRFHYAANISVETESGTDITRTKNLTGGNLAIIPLHPGNMAPSVEQGDAAVEREKLEPAPILKFSLDTELPIRQDQVLYPYKGAKEQAKVLPLAPDKLPNKFQSAMRVSTPTGADFIAFGDNTCTPQTYGGNKLRLAGRSAVIRTGNKGDVRSFFLAMGKALVLKKQALAMADTPVSALDVTYSGNIVLITAKNPCQSLKIWSGSAKKAVVNGRSMPIKPVNGFIQPFASLPKEKAVIVDCETPGFVIHKPFIGGRLTTPNAYGMMYHWCHTAPGRDMSCSWTPELKKSGTYEIRAYIPANHHDLSDCAHYTVSFKPGGKYKLAQGCAYLIESSKPDQGIVSLRANLRPYADKWITLGTFECGPGSKLTLQADSMGDRGPVVVADAVKWVEK